jgi:aryl-alcohol dehydrogenase-like predicted oxidoreductase
MEQIEFVESGLKTSRIGLGTWAMGGWMSGRSQPFALPSTVA